VEPHGDTLYAALLLPLTPVYSLQISTHPTCGRSPRSFIRRRSTRSISLTWKFANVHGRTKSSLAANFQSGVAGLKGVHGTAGVVSRIRRARCWAQIPSSTRRSSKRAISRDRTMPFASPRTRAGQHMRSSIAAPRRRACPTLVVVRDDSIGFGSNKFRALLDTPVVDSAKSLQQSRRTPGIRVATCREVPYFNGTDPTFGNQRRVSANLSITVDPSPFGAHTVWVAWADSVNASHYTST